MDVAVARLAEPHFQRVHFFVNAALDLAPADGGVMLEGVPAGAGAVTRPVPVLIFRPSRAAHVGLLTMVGEL